MSCCFQRSYMSWCIVIYLYVVDLRRGGVEDTPKDLGRLLGWWTSGLVRGY